MNILNKVKYEVSLIVVKNQATLWYSLMKLPMVKKLHVPIIRNINILMCK